MFHVASKKQCRRFLLFIVMFVCFVLTSGVYAATTQKRYYAYDAVEDKYGVIAPWYTGLNGQCDLRVRIAAETLKRYPWTTTDNAIAVYPHYIFNGVWNITDAGTITPLITIEWNKGDLGQRATSVLNGFVDYYRYTGDPAAIAHITYMADYILDHCVTADDHPWPGIFISVPIQGKMYQKADPHGIIQLDIVGSTGEGLLRAYQLTGNQRWLEAARHWADVLAEKCNLDPDADPWPRYANPDDAAKIFSDFYKTDWYTRPLFNKQTSGAVMITRFLDEVLRTGYTGKDDAVVAARDAGRRYLRDKLLPAWLVNDTWGRYFWDIEADWHNALITADVVRYLMDNKAEFGNWRHDVRNILTLFFNHTSTDPQSGSDVFSGGWAYPESFGCCGRSLWYSPFIHAPFFAQYAEATGDAWMRELAYRQIVLNTYDIHETGVTEDNIDGGTIVNGAWFNIAHPLPLRFVLAGIGWMPEELGASRENHIVRSTAVVNSVRYGDGRIEYTTFDAPDNTVEVLRLAFVPKEVTADGKKLKKRANIDKNGYTVKKLPNGDAIVTIRHDGQKAIVITGNDPQEVIRADAFAFEGEWKTESDLRVAEAAGASLTTKFTGNQVRLIGRAEPTGGLADVYLDGIKQLVPIDCWNPTPRDHQVLYYKNGLTQGTHTLKIVARGENSFYSKGTRIGVEAVQFSEEDKVYGYPVGNGPVDTQRMIFGYPNSKDYRDSKGNNWRPATEVITRTGNCTDSVKLTWWTNPDPNTISGTSDPELYRYGMHKDEFWANLTVGPDTYYIRLKFAATRNLDTRLNCFDILINGQPVVKKLDVAATAGGPNRAVDLVFHDIKPKNGIIEVRFKSVPVMDGGQVFQGEAFVQALELGTGRGGKGAEPVSSSAPKPTGVLPVENK